MKKLVDYVAVAMFTASLFNGVAIFAVIGAGWFACRGYKYLKKVEKEI